MPRTTLDLHQQVIETIKAAQEHEYLAGLRWYQDAHLIALELGVRYGVSLEQVAGVIAALSPQKDWKHNLLFTEEILQLWQQGREEEFRKHTKTQNRKAVRILRGEDPRRVLHGPKERPFFINIAQDSDEEVTVDRHILKFAQRFTDWPGLTDARIREISQWFVLGARELGILPKQAQAIVWVVMRGSAE